MFAQKLIKGWLHFEKTWHKRKVPYTMRSALRVFDKCHFKVNVNVQG